MCGGVYSLVQQFQELEEQRIAYLRHQMWTLCNLCSQTTVYEDQVGDVIGVVSFRVMSFR